MPTNSANGKQAAAKTRGVRRIYDVAVLGGGASGMAAALSAASLGAGTLLLEAQPRVGRKLLSTGNGRCNISNRYISPDRYRTDCAKRLETVLGSVGQERVSAFFSDIGVPVLEEREGRLYPRGDAAAGVLDMLRFALERTGVEVLTERRVTALEHTRGLWKIKTNDGSEYTARAAIISCGSPAAPQLGGCADGDLLAGRLGIRVIKRRPSLCPLLSGSPVLRSLKGLRARCRAELVVHGESIHSEEGEMQFSDGGLSGICVFQLSARLRQEDIGDARVTADLVPDMTAEELLIALRERRSLLGTLAAEDFLTGMLNKRIAQAVLRLAGITPLSRLADTLTGGELQAIAHAMKKMSFDITGWAGWKQSQSALGGIPLSALDDSLCVQGMRGLYACGEAINCSGDCGGFNLHWAWCSGMTAGEAAAIYSAAEKHRDEEK